MTTHTSVPDLVTRCADCGHPEADHYAGECRHFLNPASVICACKAFRPAESAKPREFLIARFDVTDLTAGERDALAGEVQVQGERSDEHPEAVFVGFDEEMVLSREEVDLFNALTNAHIEVRTDGESFDISAMLAAVASVLREGKSVRRHDQTVDAILEFGRWLRTTGSQEQS